MKTTDYINTKIKTNGHELSFRIIQYLGDYKKIVWPSWKNQKGHLVHCAGFRWNSPLSILHSATFVHCVHKTARGQSFEVTVIQRRGVEWIPLILASRLTSVCICTQTPPVFWVPCSLWLCNHLAPLDSYSMSLSRTLPYCERWMLWWLHIGASIL